MRLILFAGVLLAFFGLVSLPLAARPASSNPFEPVSLPETSLRASVLITFTPVATIYLPSTIKNYSSVPNDVLIADLQPGTSDEYIEIRNNGPGSQSMAGWTILSVVGSQTYVFSPTVTLAPGQAVRIHSGPDAVSAPPTDLVWTAAYIWNNGGDKAELYDAQNNLRDEWEYGNPIP